MTKPTPNTISERIKVRMASLNLNQTKLSKDSGVERSALNRCIKGDRPWRREHLARLAPVLGQPLEELIAGAAEETQIANEESAQQQTKEMENALAEAITRAQERDAQTAAVQAQLEAAQQALDKRPTQEALEELRAKLADAEERERATASRMAIVQKQLEDESAKRQATEKKLASLHATYEKAVSLAEKNHKAAEQNKYIANYWKAQFESSSEQLKIETSRANYNYEIAIQHGKAAEQQTRRANSAESSAGSAKGLALLATVGALSLLGTMSKA